LFKDDAEIEEMAEQIRINVELQSQPGIEGKSSSSSLPGFEPLLAIT
jgi:hypothetical protein